MGWPRWSLFLCQRTAIFRGGQRAEGESDSPSGLLLKVGVHRDSPGTEGRLSPRFCLCHSVRPQGGLSGFSVSRPSSVWSSRCDVRQDTSFPQTLPSDRSHPPPSPRGDGGAVDLHLRSAQRPPDAGRRANLGKPRGLNLRFCGPAPAWLLGGQSGFRDFRFRLISSRLLLFFSQNIL